jgi:hypothetical protein
VKKDKKMNLINKSAVKECALEAASMYRAQAGLTRVSSDFLEYIEARVKHMIIDQIKRQPSLGKTIQPLSYH